MQLSYKRNEQHAEMDAVTGKTLDFLVLGEDKHVLICMKDNWIDPSFAGMGNTILQVVY